MAFYVYVYLDPRKPGKFQYLEYSFEYEPFYIGKGHKNRMYFHRHLLGKNNLKNGILSKLKALNLEPIILKVKENICEIQAFELEKQLIALIGRRDLKKGPLANMTNGGEGAAGSLGCGGEKNPMYGKTHTEETRKRISLLNRIKANENILSGKHNFSKLHPMHDPEIKQRAHSKRMQKLLEQVKSGSHLFVRNNPMYNPEVVAKNKGCTGHRWALTEERRKQISLQNRLRNKKYVR